MFYKWIHKWIQTGILMAWENDMACLSDIVTLIAP